MKKTLSIILLFLFFASARAQYITTIAGTGAMSYSGDGGPAILATINHPGQLAVDSVGNVYVADDVNSRIRKISVAGIITTVVGNGTFGYSGDGGPADSAEVGGPVGLALDGKGNLYISSGACYCVRKVDAAGIITTIAGSDTEGFSGDGGPAISAKMGIIGLIAADKAGNVYLTDAHNQRIRNIDTNGIITTIIGTGTSGYSGDGGLATSAEIGNPCDVTVDGIGNVYITDSNHVIHKVDTAGIISTYAGTGSLGYSGDGGPATLAAIGDAYAVTADVAGNIYIVSQSDSGSVMAHIRKVNTSGIISTYAGAGPLGYTGDGGPAIDAEIYATHPAAMYGSGDIYFADGANRIRRISAVPSFVYAPVRYVTICNTTYNLDGVLAANDANSGNTVSWSLLSGPFHGIASGAYTTVSTGNIVYPSGFSYTVTPGYTGMDTIVARITDSLASDTITLYLNILPPIAGTITGPDTVCMTKTITLTDTTSGGTWGATNADAAVSGGIVSGITAGIDTITYTAHTNECGTVAAMYTVVIQNCTAGISNITANDVVKVYPDPTDGTFTISFAANTNETAQAQITNTAGNKIKDFTLIANEEKTIHLDAPAGVYFINIKTGQATYNTKIIIAK